MFCLFLASAPFPHWHLDIWMFKLFLQNFICFAKRLLFDIYQEGEKKNHNMYNSNPKHDYD